MFNFYAQEEVVVELHRLLNLCSSTTSLTLYEKHSFEVRAIKPEFVVLKPYVSLALLETGQRPHLGKTGAIAVALLSVIRVAYRNRTFCVSIRMSLKFNE